MNKLATHPTIAPLLRALGVDPVQYTVLLDLFSKLSKRQEFEAGNARLSVQVTVGMFALLGALFNLFIAFAARPPVRLYIFGNFIFTTFMLVLILTMEAINTFLNPVEASVLAHQPIRDRSYLAAKLTYLGSVVAYVVFPINIAPALFGLNLRDSSWFYTPLYLVSAYLLGLFIGLITCGVLGLLFRILPVARLRNTVLWMQVGFFLLMAGGVRTVE